MHISIAGKLGSGKSTICKFLQKKHGFEIYSTGAVQREAAKKMGISTLELNQRMLTDPALDHVIDDEVARLSRERRKDAIIFDSRMAWYFAERSFKIFVTVDPLIAAQRVMHDPRGSEETYQDVLEACNKLLEREKLKTRVFAIFIMSITLTITTMISLLILLSPRRKRSAKQFTTAFLPIRHSPGKAHV